MNPGGLAGMAAGTGGSSSAGSVVVKSIQRGVAATSGTFGGTTTVAISPVDANKSICFSSVQSGKGADVNGAPHALIASCDITSSNQLTITQGQGSGGGVSYAGTVRWTVVEYY